MPGLFNYSQELLNVDWQTIIFYTCSEECNTATGAYAEEHVVIEFSDEREQQFDIDSANVMDLNERRKKQAQAQAPREEVKQELEPESQQEVEKLLADIDLD